MIYLCHEYLADMRGNKSPDDYVGPFPSKAMAKAHRKVYGPVDSKLVDLPQSPDPQHIMTPGEAADYVLARSW